MFREFLNRAKYPDIPSWMYPKKITDITSKISPKLRRCQTGPSCDEGHPTTVAQIRYLWGDGPIIIATLPGHRCEVCESEFRSHPVNLQYLLEVQRILVARKSTTELRAINDVIANERQSIIDLGSSVY